MQSKIEPGMLCLVIGGRNAGRECTVIRRLKSGEIVPEIGGYPDVDCWLITGPNIEIQICSKWIYHHGIGTEDILMPLANGGDDAIVKSEVNDYENCSTII